MENIKFRVQKKHLVLLLLTVLGSLAISVQSRPSVYTGFLFSLCVSFLIGMYGNLIESVVLPIISSSLGLILRQLNIFTPLLKGDKLEKHLAYANFISHYFWAMIILALLLGYLGHMASKKIQLKKLNFSSFTLAYASVFIALGVIINTLRIGQVSFGGFPIILSGYFLGPVYGFIVGGVTDVAAFLVRPSAYPFNVLYTLTSALTGLLPILISRQFKEKMPKFSFKVTLFSIAVGQMITSLLLVSLFRMWFEGNPFLFYFLQALPKQMISIPIYAFLVVAMVDRIGKLIKMN